MSSDTVVKGNTSFEFVTGGIDDALARARATAGGQNVIVMGGADLLRQYLAAGKIDEFTLTIASILLGAGKQSSTGSQEQTSSLSAPA